MNQYLENRTKALEEWWDNTDMEFTCIRNALVVSYLRSELRTCYECLFDPTFNAPTKDSDLELIKALHMVINYVADCGDNEDMRTDRMEIIDEAFVTEIYNSIQKRKNKEV